MLSCLSNCCPNLFSRNTTVHYQPIQKTDSNASTPETNRRHTGLPPLSTQPVTNYNSISPPTSNAILTNHLNKLTKGELRASNPAIATSFYSTIPKELCTKEFGKNLIKQIFNATSNIEHNFNLTLLFIKHTPASKDIKRELQIETRNLMCHTALLNQRTSLGLLDTYYKSIDLTDPSVIKNEKDAIPTLGTHPDWVQTVTNVLNAAIQIQSPTNTLPTDIFLTNINRDSALRDPILYGK